MKKSSKIVTLSVNADDPDWPVSKRYPPVHIPDLIGTTRVAIAPEKKHPLDLLEVSAVAEAPCADECRPGFDRSLSALSNGPSEAWAPVPLR